MLADLPWGRWLSLLQGAGWTWWPWEAPANQYLKHSVSTALLKGQAERLKATRGTESAGVSDGTEVFEPAPYLWDLWDYEFISN